MKAVLFDVDGTLIRLEGAGKRSLVQAFVRTFELEHERVERAFAEVDFRGNTDLAILEQVARHLVLTQDGMVERVMPVYLEILREAVAGISSAKLTGVDDLVAQLERRDDVVVGLLTGNFREGARVKLAPFELAFLTRRPGGFGDDAHRREQIAQVAIERLSCDGVLPDDVVVIGDTARDVSAAHAVGATAVAVCTGWTPASELTEAGADLVLPDLAQPAPLWDLLD